ncbi:MAG TPA: chemotaxis protein CheA, partial [Urbifossiella sp.]
MTPIEPAMFELFVEEVRAHAAALSAGLVEFEADAAKRALIEPLMRASHSIKGAARIVGIELAVQLAHVMEDAFVAAQAGRIHIDPAAIDHLLHGADILAGLGQLADAGAIPEWEEHHRAAVARLEPLLQKLAAGHGEQPEAIPKEEPSLRSEDAASRPIDEFPPTTDLSIISNEPIVFDSDYGMLDLFREELRAHLFAIRTGIVALESNGTPLSDDVLERFRQLRGSARIMKCQPIVDAVGGMSESLGTIHPARNSMSGAAIAWLKYAINVLAGAIATDSESFPQWLNHSTEALQRISSIAQQGIPESRSAPRHSREIPADPPAQIRQEPRPPQKTETPAVPTSAAASHDGVVRVTAQSLNRLMGLAGESLVQARWLNVFSSTLVKLKKQHEHLAGMLDTSLQAAAAGRPADQIANLVAETRRHAALCREQLTGNGVEFDEHAARAEDLNSRLYREVIASRMRPFADGLHGLARTVRDMARALGKQARLEVIGEGTEVDRDVLEKLEAPLTHLIRNAVDHGIDPPEERAAAGKNASGTVRVEAHHRAGMLSVTIADDGRGVNLEKLRRKIIERGLNSAELVRQMSEAELLEFLFLPGFSTAGNVTEYSGRGVGLDVVQDTVRRIGGSVRITTKLGEGTTFHLQLPITLSVIRAVVVEIGGESYAFPHTRIDRLLRVPRGTVHSLEHRQYVTVDGQNVGLVLAGQLLDVPADP